MYEEAREGCDMQWQDEEQRAWYAALADGLKKEIRRDGKARFVKPLFSKFAGSSVPWF